MKSFTKKQLDERMIKHGLQCDIDPAKCICGYAQIIEAQSEGYRVGTIQQGMSEEIKREMPTCLRRDDTMNGILWQYPKSKWLWTDELSIITSGILKIHYAVNNKEAKVSQICPRCNTYMERADCGHLYCPSCEAPHSGWNTECRDCRLHGKRNKNRTMKIEATITQNPAYSLAKRVVAIILDDGNVPHFPIVFKNRLDARHVFYHATKKHQIIYGYYAIDSVMKNGIYSITGLEAVYQLSIHIAAHAIICCINSSNAHDEMFYNVVRGLSEKYPFNSFIKQ